MWKGCECIMSLLKVYSKKNYSIYEAHGEYIVHNLNKPFEDGHTHINRFDTAKFLLNLALHHSVPRHVCDYFITSLLRLSDNDKYTEHLLSIQTARKNRGSYNRYYINNTKFVRRK